MKIRQFSFAVLIAFTAFSTVLFAQQYDVLDQVRADARKSWAMEGPHRMDEFGPLTKAPCGYKPFYISHYGRHGSRYAWSAKTYTIIHEVLSKAAETGSLTPFGQSLYQRYEAFYLEPWINTGDLVPLGFEQHQQIGDYVARSFPKVFRGAREVSAISSTAQRSIVSMGAFTLGLKGQNPRLKISQASDHKGMTVAAPPSAPKALIRHFAGEENKPALESVDSFFARNFDVQAVLDRLFSDQAFLKEFDGGVRFLKELWQLVCGYHNYRSEPLFEDIFTPEEMVSMWECDNYSSFYGDVGARYSEIPLLEDIVGKAEYAFSHPERAADLRFGHDYILEALSCLLNINGCGTIPDTPEEVKYWFQSYNIPMAATLLFVFYRNGRGDILFKLLLNEREVALADLTPVKGPYYRWTDFKAWYETLRAAHPEIL